MLIQKSVHKYFQQHFSGSLKKGKQPNYPSVSERINKLCSSRNGCSSAKKGWGHYLPRQQLGWISRLYAEWMKPVVKVSILYDQCFLGIKAGGRVSTKKLHENIFGKWWNYSVFRCLQKSTNVLKFIEPCTPPKFTFTVWLKKKPWEAISRLDWGGSGEQETEIVTKRQLSKKLS